jgi:predicted RNase H-like HicB family nuclease
MRRTSERRQVWILDKTFCGEPAIRGCVASGETLQEAYRNAIDAIASCLEARRTVGVH